MPTKDESVVKESKKRERPEQVWNEKTNRWVKKDVGKQIEEKKKEKKDKKEREERKREREAAKKEKEELESENKRLKSLVVPSLLAA